MSKPIVWKDIFTWNPIIWIPIALTLALASCAGVPQIVLACETASSTTFVLTAMKARGQLSAVQIAQVGQTVDLIDPICGAAVLPTNTGALDTINRAILQLNGVKLAPARAGG